MTTATSAEATAVAGPDEPLLDVADDSAEGLYALLESNRWGDGLPVVAPTPERVERMLAAWPGSPEEVLAVLPPRFGACTARIAAVNAVMAGCPPEVFPVVATAIRGLGRPEFNLRGVNATTHSVAIMVMVHGEIAAQAGFNAAAGAMGPGNRANATTGRAIRLILLNCAGATPGDGDASTQGSPAKYTFCFAENSEASPWPTYPRSVGVEAASAVTVAGVEGPHNSHDQWSTEIVPILDKAASVMATTGSNNAAMIGSEFFVVLCPEHAQLAAAAGWSRQDVQLFLYDRARLPLQVFIDAFGHDRRAGAPWAAAFTDPQTPIPMVSPPERIRVLVAGGPGKHSCVIPSWGEISMSVTLGIDP